MSLRGRAIPDETRSDLCNGVAMKSISLLVLLSCTVLAAPALAVDEAEQEPPTVEAFWNDYELDFSFMGISTFYSCEGLRDKVKFILSELGARDDLRVTARGCEIGGGVARFPRARIKVALPMAATTENIAELEKDADKRELVARVRGERYVDPGEAAARFPATLETVRISSRDMRRIENGDCELLEQVERSLLPKLNLTPVDSNLSCVPGQARIGEIWLDVRMLKKMPTPDDVE